MAVGLVCVVHKKMATVGVARKTAALDRRPRIFAWSITNPEGPFLEVSLRKRIATCLEKQHLQTGPAELIDGHSATGTGADHDHIKFVFVDEPLSHERKDTNKHYARLAICSIEGNAILDKKKPPLASGGFSAKNRNYLTAFLNSMPGRNFGTL